MEKELKDSKKIVSFRKMFGLAGPIFCANFSLVCSGTIDTIMAGQQSANDLAGVALGIAVATWISISLAGMLQGVSPVVGYQFGAKRYKDVAASLQHCLYFAFMLAVPGMFLTFWTDMWMKVASPAPEVAVIACDYLGYMALALPAILICRSFIAVNAAVSRPTASMMVTLTVVALKVPVNYLFMYGGLGIDPMGGAGAGASSFCLNWFAVCFYILIWFADPYYKRMHRETISWWNFDLLRKLVTVGVPIGLSIFFEMSSYTLMAIFIARINAVSLAAHQIGANIVWLYYVIPFAFGQAGTVMVAQSLGAKEPQSARKASFMVLSTATAGAFIVSFLTYVFRSEIAALYTADPEVQRVAIGFLTVVVFYHIVDAVQCGGSCILRGYRITFVPMVIYSFLLCGFGMPLGYSLSGFVESFPWDFGAIAFWYGASTGLTLTAIFIAPFTIYSANKKAGRAPWDLSWSEEKAA